MHLQLHLEGTGGEMDAPNSPLGCVNFVCGIPFWCLPFGVILSGKNLLRALAAVSGYIKHHRLKILVFDQQCFDESNVFSYEIPWPLQVT